MFTRFLAAAGFAVVLAQGPATAAEITPDSKDKAAEACQALNQYGPVTVAATAEDGLGDWLVWVKDKDDDLWMCNASAHGAVYTNVLMQGDLLKGDGSALVSLRNVADTGSGGSRGASEAEALCAAVGSYIEDMQVVVTVDDGLGDYVTWLKNADEQLWVCNASGDAKLYDFEPVDLPLNDIAPAPETRNA